MPHTLNPPANTFGECGGCEFQDIPYPDQATAKRSALIELIASKGLSTLIDTTNIELVQSPKALGYRQRMDYVFAFNKGGLRKRNSHKWVIELEECPLLGNTTFNTFIQARALAREQELLSYNYLNHQGFLRYFVIRRTRLGETMLSLVTKNRENSKEIEEIAHSIITNGLASSVHWLLQESLSDMSFGESIQHWGAEYIREEYLGKSFFIAPNTFFQANPDVAEMAYYRIRDQVSKTAPEFVIDTYSGTGIIAQLLADKVKHVVAVENVKDNLTIAAANLKYNAISNVELVEADALHYLRDLECRLPHIVVNPPRVGLGEKAARAILKLAPDFISYMSCNPLTLMSDLDILKEEYSVEECTLYDMFPQTRHWETLLLLQRK